MGYHKPMITEEEFKILKNYLRKYSLPQVRLMYFSPSITTLKKIRRCRNYKEYRSGPTKLSIPIVRVWGRLLGYPDIKTVILRLLVLFGGTTLGLVIISLI